MRSWFETTFSNHFSISTTVILFEKNYCKLVESRNFSWIGISQSGVHGIIGIIMCIESYLIFKNFLNLEFFPNIEPSHIDFAFDH